MLGIIGFILLMAFSAYASAGLTKLFFVLIEPDELLGGWHPKVNWNKLLMKLDVRKGDKSYYNKNFLYKRLGGCGKCTCGQINMISFTVLMVLSYYTPLICPTSFIPYTWLQVLFTVILYAAYSATSITIFQLGEYEKKETDSLEKLTETTFNEKPKPERK